MSMASAPTAAAWDSLFFEFPARAYLEKYYSEVGDENSAFLRAILHYLASTAAPTDTVIEVGGGPCLFSLMAIAAHRQRAFRHLTFTDVGWKNLAEVDCWLRNDPRQFDYQPLLDWLQREVGVAQATVTEGLRKSRWELRHLDWRDEPPVEWKRHYDVVSSHFFAESATNDQDDFLDLLRKLGRLGRPGAVVLLSFMCRSAGYRIADRDFPAVSVDEERILDDLRRAGLDLVDPVLTTAPTEDPASQPGYDGMVFVCGRLS